MKPNVEVSQTLFMRCLDLYSTVTAALDLLVAERYSPRRLAKVARDSIFVAFSCENER